jgi:translation initiation factor 3 subunit C
MCTSESLVIVRYIFNFQFSDEEEETKRVVRSAKEKRYEDLTNIMKQIRNFKKIKDMSSMLSSKYTFLPFIYINDFTL